MIYTYDCSVCGKFDRVIGIKHHVNRMECPKCGLMSNQVICPPVLIIPKNVSYISPITGAHISSEKQRHEDMVSSGCVEYDPCIRQDTDRIAKESQQRLDRQIDDTVDKEFEMMPSHKKERLCAELSAGLDVETVRA